MLGLKLNCVSKRDPWWWIYSIRHWTGSLLVQLMVCRLFCDNAIIWTNIYKLSAGLLGTNRKEFWIKIRTCSFRPFCSGLSLLVSEQMAFVLQKICFNSCYWKNTFVYWFKFTDGLIVCKSALVQVMAWCLTGDKPLPEPMLTEICDA